MYRTIRRIFGVSISILLFAGVLIALQGETCALAEPNRGLPTNNAYSLNHETTNLNRPAGSASSSRQSTGLSSRLGSAYIGSSSSGSMRSIQLAPSLRTGSSPLNVPGRRSEFGTCGVSYESPPAAHMPPPDYIVSRPGPAYGSSVYGVGSEPIPLDQPEINSAAVSGRLSAASSLPPIDTTGCETYTCRSSAPWRFQLLPSRILFQSYLAGVHEPRIGMQLYQEKDLRHGLWDSTVGGRVGLLRYGTEAGRFSEGIQIDLEGAAFPRMDFDPQYDLDINAVDFRVGAGLTFRKARWEGKLAYYHMSAHLGDEYILAGRPGTRINYVRDSIVLALGFWLCDDLRLYTEAGYAIKTDGGAEPWEFQFGVDWCTTKPTGFWGAPFFAVNGHISEENDFGGHVTAEAGWAWRGEDGHLIRIGAFYHNGTDNMYEFYMNNVQQVGFGVWYDF